MNQHQHSTQIPKKPFQLTDDLERSYYESRISNMRYNHLQQSLSPKVARDYLNTLKDFVSNHVESKQAQYSSRRIIGCYLFVWNKFHDDIKFITSQKIEIRKNDITGQVKSLRYFYLKNPIINSVGDVLAHHSVTIMGNKQSGKKKLLYELLQRNGGIWKISISSENQDFNTQIKGEYRTTIKSLLKNYKKKSLILSVFSDKHSITVKDLCQAEGCCIVCMNTSKQSLDQCKKTLKFIEQNY